MQAWDIFRKAFGTTMEQSQIINWIWYDTQLYTSGTTTRLAFFQTLQATRNLGNMEIAGVLAHPKAFIIRAIRVHFKQIPLLSTTAPAANASSDIALLTNNGSLALEVGNKNYGIWQPHMLPGGAGVYTELAGAGGEAIDEFVSYAANGVPDPRAIYTLSQPLMIEPQINFNVTMEWPAAQTLTGNLNIEVMLDGELLRPVQ